MVTRGGGNDTMSGKISYTGWSAHTLKPNGLLSGLGVWSDGDDALRGGGIIYERVSQHMEQKNDTLQSSHLKFP